MPSVFLSHSHADKKFARTVAADLRRAGHIVWIDEAEIKIGDSLIEKIREGIDKVDFVAAVLSVASIQSQWVKRELDIASNREIEEKRVVVLPLLIEDVELPGFLKGKFFGDFRAPERYEETIARLLEALGPAQAPPKMNVDEIEQLKAELEAAKRVIAHHAKERERRNVVISSQWSERLKQAVNEANRKFPQHKLINDAYAFEALNMPITLDYLLWAIAKAGFRGAHPLEALLSIDDKWLEADAMIEAYSDYLNLDVT